MWIANLSVKWGQEEEEAEEQECEPQAELQVHRLLEGEPRPPNLWGLRQPPS